MIYYGHDVYLDTIPSDPKTLEKLRQWRNDPTIWAWCRQNDLISDVDQLNWFQNIVHGDPTVKMYLIRRQDGDVVGVCGLTDLNRWHQRAEFSLYIAPSFQKCGYAYKALKTLFQHAFMNFNLQTVWGETFDGNHALKLFKKLGMTVDGYRRQFYFKDGKFIGATLVSVTKDEWLKSYSQLS